MLLSGGVRFPEQLQTSHLKHNRLFLWPQLLFPSALWPQSCSVASDDMCSENSFSPLSPSHPPTLLKMQSLLCDGPRSFTLNIAAAHSRCHPSWRGGTVEQWACTEPPTPVWKLAEDRHSALAPSCRRQGGSQCTLPGQGHVHARAGKHISLWSWATALPTQTCSRACFRFSTNHGLGLRFASAPCLPGSPGPTRFYSLTELAACWLEHLRLLLGASSFVSCSALSLPYYQERAHFLGILRTSVR